MNVKSGPAESWHRFLPDYPYMKTNKQNQICAKKNKQNQMVKISSTINSAWYAYPNKKSNYSSVEEIIVEHKNYIEGRGEEAT
jgi:hypothetical protein